MAIVQFNRHFTQAQLTAAVGTSSIAGTTVVDGTWYIAKTGAKALYVGSIESGSTPTLKLIAQLNENPTGEQITNLINTYIASTQSPTLITKVDSAVKDGSGNTITSTYLDKTTNSSQTVAGPVGFSNGVTITGDATITAGNLNVNTIQPEDEDLTSVVVIGGLEASGDITTTGDIYTGSDATLYTDNVIPIAGLGVSFGDNPIKDVGTPEDSGDAANKDYVDNTVSSATSALDGTITKTAGSASASTAANAYQKVPVVSGFVLKEVDGKLIETNAASGPSTVSTVDVDAAGSAQKALNDAKDYADDLIEGLGTIMHFEGTVATEAALKALINKKKGDVYIVTADSSEWVCTKDITTADPTAWEKFGTTDVQGALYKTTDSDYHYSESEILVSDGTSGAVRSVGFSTVTGDTSWDTPEKQLFNSVSFDGNDLCFETYQIKKAKNLDQGEGYGVVAGGTGVSINEGVISMDGSGSVGTASSDAGAWKTVVHDATLSGATLSGNTKSIPAATGSNDGYMTSTQAGIVSDAAKSVDKLTPASNVVNAYASCSTAAGTAAKTATIDSGNIPTSGSLAGLRVAIKFTNANTASTPTLNVSGSSTGSTGAKNIYVNGAKITTGSNKGILKGVCIFIYDGTQWHLIGGGSDYAAGDGLTLTNNTFSVNYNFGLMTDEVPGVLMVKTGEGNCLNGDDHSEYGPGIPEGSWKKPIIAQQNQGGSYYGPNLNDYNSSVDGEVSVGSAYQSIPAATAAATAAASTDGYMTGQQAYNLALATACLTWEE